LGQAIRVPVTDISEPEWRALIGGNDEASWLADRDRKLGLILSLSHEVLKTAEALQRRGVLFAPSADVLAEMPFAADWYVSLAGFALKTLGNIRDAPAMHGLTHRAVTVRDKFVTGRTVPHDQAEAFASWLREEIAAAWLPEQRTADRAVAVVSAILGGRALGQGQNVAGSDAVAMLKSIISVYAERNDMPLHVLADGQWTAFGHAASVTLVPSMRVNETLAVAFPVGGNVPDVEFRDFTRNRILAVGEVKGRKDRSNTWESWMPQVGDHMRTWTKKYPNALRLFFGTLITKEMVEGRSVAGTRHIGLRGLHDGGNLNAVFNLSRLALGEPAAVGAFDQLMSYLMA
jgi:hypothetical protein